jgi:CTP:molybdopterin cytidylyltransferase MocA
MSGGAFTVLIPARMASSRLPNKPLADIGGAPMVVRVAQQAALSQASRCVVAADDERIVKACADHGVSAILTRVDHPNGTSRLAEALCAINAACVETIPSAANTTATRVTTSSLGIGLIINNRPEDESDDQTPGAEIEAAAIAAGDGPATLAEKVTACCSAIPTSKARSGIAFIMILSEEPEGIAGVTPMIFGFISANSTSV